MKSINEVKLILPEDIQLLEFVEYLNSCMQAADIVYDFIRVDGNHQTHHTICDSSHSSVEKIAGGEYYEFIVREK